MEDVVTHKRNIIQDYGDFGSQVYAGISRQGLTLDKLANKYEVQPVALNNFAGLSEIEPPIEKEKKVTVKEPRLEITHKKALDIAQSGIEKKLKPERKEDEIVSNDIEALRKVVARPVTPNWKNDDNFILYEWKSGINKQELKE